MPAKPPPERSARRSAKDSLDPPLDLTDQLAQQLTDAIVEGLPSIVVEPLNPSDALANGFRIRLDFKS